MTKTARAALDAPSPGLFRFTSLAGRPVRQAMSMRRADLPSDGDVAYSRDTDDDDVRASRAAFLRDAAIAPAALTLGRQVHGTAIALVTAADSGRGLPPAFDAIPDTDGLITGDPEAAIGVIVADCVPLILYDPANHTLGLVHAGWRGTVGAIAARAVESMTAAFGTRPEDLMAGIGPSIGPCCYEVGDEVIDAWRHSGIAGREGAVVERLPRAHFDLWAANALTLHEAGVPGRNIEVRGLCTRCESERFFSHRAAMAGERKRGRMIMVAQLEEIASRH